MENQKLEEQLSRTPAGRVLREDALHPADRGWLDGPFPFDEDGGPVTSKGPQWAIPTFRFGQETKGSR